MVKIDKADRLFSLYVRTRDKWACRRCGRQYNPPTKALHCSHFMGRSKENTRFNPDNADALCYGCHQYFTSQPAEHLQWQIKTKGSDMVDSLRYAAHLYKKKDRKLEALYWAQKLKEDFDI